MALSPNDLLITVINPDPNNSNIEVVIGKPITFSVLFSNISSTDILYNLGFILNLPDGMSYISSNYEERLNIISNNSNIITFTNIKDLYTNELNFKVDITVTIDETFRLNGLSVPFNLLFSNVKLEATGDSKPRGNLDSGNINISKSIFLTFKSIRYKIVIKFPPKYLKGAGQSSSDPITATSIFNGSLELINNSREQSTISLNLDLANGIRYIGNFSSSGTDASVFTTPIVTGVSGTQDYVSLAFNSKTLSASSDTTLSFDAAIWNNLTLNGVENSGSLITNNQSLTSTLSSNDGTSYSYQSEAILALELYLEKTVANAETDVSNNNLFTLSYMISEYINLDNFVLTDIIPDGMSYLLNSTSTIYDSITNNGNGTTTLLWNLGNLSAGTNSEITFITITEETYIDSSFVYSSDILTNTASISSYREGTTDEILIESSVDVAVSTPIISKEIIKYYYEDLSEKPFNIGTVGDFIEFKITYDASSIIAKQHDVFLFDYPPLNMDTTNTPSTIETTGDYPITAIASTAPDNGLMINLGDLNGGTYFTASFKIPITSPYIYSELPYNLGKAVLLSSDNRSISVRDSVTVSFGTPNLTLNSSLSSNACFALNNNYSYIFNIANPVSIETTDGFNLDLSIAIPNILAITTGFTVNATNANYDTPIVSNNLITMKINHISPGGSISLSFNSTVNSSVIMGKSYPTTAVLTNGTSQATSSSYEYLFNDINSTISRSGCLPTITKSFTPDTIKLGDNYKSTIKVDFPIGILAYNVNLIDYILTSNSSNITSLKLNGSNYSYSVNGNNLTVAIIDTLNTSSGALSYSLEYYDKTYSVTPTDYEQSKIAPANLWWSEALNNQNSLNISTTDSITIVVPNITIEKTQKNISQSTDYESSEILCKLNDNISYNLSLLNNGKATAYNISLTDIIPDSLKFLSFSGSDGNFDINTNTLTINIPMLNVNSSKTITINSYIQNTETVPIATNIASCTYKASSTIPTIFNTATSNNTYLLEDFLTIEKFQRNIAESDIFTKNSINCLKDQTIDFKVIIKNNHPYEIANITITDNFPNPLTFISYELTKGTFSLTENDITILIDSLQPSEEIILTYNLTLNGDYLGRISSKSNIDYTFQGGTTLFTKNSNTIYTILSSVGRGFKVY